MKSSSLFLLFVVLFNASTSHARWRPQFGPPPFKIDVEVLRTFGDGCPMGSVAATMSPDQTSVSLLFDQLLTEIPPSPTPTQARRTCYVTLGIKFIGQYRVAIAGSDVRGFASVPMNAMSTITVSHNSIYISRRHQDRMNFTKKIMGPAEENIEMFSRFQDALLWSQCGTQMRYGPTFPFMTISIEINSQNRNANENLIAAIDSFDYSTNAPLSYHLAWTPDTKNCPR